MKRFFSLFTDSAKEFKNIRSLSVAGMLLAVAIAIRTLALDITPEIRITFAYIPIVMIAVLYGPVVCLSANVMLDFLGVLLSPKGGAYYPPLAIAPIVAGIIYGVILYKKELNLILLSVSRIIVVLFCNIMLNSLILYTGFFGNKLNFSSKDSMHTFFVWLLPRITKNIGQLPFDIILLCVVVPLVLKAYHRVFNRKSA